MQIPIEGDDSGKIVDLTDEDVISRCIIFDRAFRQDIHVNEVLWHFENSDAEGIYHESAVLRRFAQTEEEVHNIGCGIAAKQNEDRKQPPPGDKRRYYCGFRSAIMASIPKNGGDYEIKLKHSPEGGVYAHVDVQLMILIDRVPRNKSPRAVARSEAILALAEQFNMPTGHRCLCDVGDTQHPFARWGENCISVGLAGKALMLGSPAPLPA